MEGFFVLPVWGAYILEGLIHGGAYFRNFMVCSTDFFCPPTPRPLPGSLPSSLFQQVNTWIEKVKLTHTAGQFHMQNSQ